MLNLEISKTLQNVSGHELMSQFSDCFMDDLSKILQEMHWAIEDQDWDKLKSCSYELKVSSEAIDAIFLAQACKYLVKSISARKYPEACKLVTQLTDSFKQMRTFLRLYQSCSLPVTGLSQLELEKCIECYYRIMRAKAFIQQACNQIEVRLTFA